jgi:hypothetical protein
MLAARGFNGDESLTGRDSFFFDDSVQRRISIGLSIVHTWNRCTRVPNRSRAEALHEDAEKNATIT